MPSRLLVSLVLAGVLAPFAIFAARDAAYHFGPRKPGAAENLVHLTLGASQLLFIVGAFRQNLAQELLGLVSIAVFGVIDEFFFHRDLPPAETDLHAKAHMFLFAFVAVALALNHLPPLLTSWPPSWSAS